MKTCIAIFFILFSLPVNAKQKVDSLSKHQIKKDLTFLDKTLEKASSYQGLNGYDYQLEFAAYLRDLKDEKVSSYDFGLFLAQTLGKIGDRHAYINGYEEPDSLFLPLAFAPYQDKVVVLEYIRDKEELDYYNEEYPYLKSVNGIPIKHLLSQILPADLAAPESAYFLHAVRELRDIEKIFTLLQLDLPNPIPLTLSSPDGEEKTVRTKLVPGTKKARLWDERFHKHTFFLTEEESNEPDIISPFFSVKENIAYVQLVDMVDREDSPVFMDFLNQFMSNVPSTDALIIDVRDNGGGTRDLIQELAGYLIHPDSVYVVNIASQRGKLPVNKELSQRLHNRFLYSKEELDPREQTAVTNFMTSFKPQYTLDPSRFSQYYYYVLNGQKLAAGKYHYDNPIYILANERTFSAASVLVSVFKSLPNIKIVGVRTDGSSGNSESFELPKSKLRGKISTMVSFQKDGKILDGLGTAPDILIERSLSQVFFKEDYQLNKLVELITNHH